VREQIKSFRSQLNQSEIRDALKRSLHSILDQSWRIQAMRQHQQEIVKLTDWLRRSSNPQKAEQYRRYIAEHRREIEKIQPEIELWKPPQV